MNPLCFEKILEINKLKISRKILNIKLYLYSFKTNYRGCFIFMKLEQNIFTSGLE